MFWFLFFVWLKVFQNWPVTRCDWAWGIRFGIFITTLLISSVLFGDFCTIWDLVLGFELRNLAGWICWVLKGYLVDGRGKIEKRTVAMCVRFLKSFSKPLIWFWNLIEETLLKMTMPPFIPLERVTIVKKWTKHGKRGEVNIEAGNKTKS